MVLNNTWVVRSRVLFEFDFSHFGYQFLEMKTKRREHFSQNCDACYDGLIVIGSREQLYICPNEQ